MKNIYFFSTLFLLSLFGLAKSNLNECKVNNYHDLVRCSEKRAEDIKILDQQLKSSQKLEEIADQWINPELELDTVAMGSEKTESNIALLFNIRLAGKKEALVNEARVEIERAMINRDLGVQKLRLELMLGLYRLAHLKSEIQIESESVDTFSKISQQYEKRPALSPEQEVSLSIFKMAQADHQLRLTKLKSDEEKIFQEVALYTGLSKNIISKNLPTSKKNWDALKDEPAIEGSLQVKSAEVDLKHAKILKAKADSEVWPDIKIGPTLKSIRENQETSTFVGVTLTMPLPVFHQNQAERNLKEQKIVEAELIADQSKRQALSTRQVLVNRYNQITENLKKTLSSNIVNEKHEQLEKQFFKGTVSASLVIEAHRQLFDLEERRNSAELDAIETFGRILIIDNKFNEVIL